MSRPAVRDDAAEQRRRNTEWRDKVRVQLSDIAAVSMKAFALDGVCYPPMAICLALREAEHEFEEGHYAKVEHLVAVIACMVERLRLKFKANPRVWVDRREDIRAMSFEDAIRSVRQL